MNMHINSMILYLDLAYFLYAEIEFGIYIYIYAFSRRFYPKRLTGHSGYTFVLSVCVTIQLACNMIRNWYG